MPLANTSTKPLTGAASTAIADKANIAPDRTPWFAKLKATDTLHDPSATVSFIVARDGQNGHRPTLALDAEALKKVHNDFSPGTVLQDRYRLIHELGRGGMGVVFLGRDQRLDRQVALKVILASDQSSSPSATMDTRLRSSFAEEARLGASLTHPAIATVFDYGFHHDNPFTVFEYIEGEMLRALVERRGRLPLDEVRLIVGPLAQALDFAHGRRIVHRDLKPENIRATEQRQFKILDLGVAREFNRQEDWRFAGTPAYAAPEQVAELPSDGRADQYALGVILFELLTGRRPFESNSWVDLLQKHYSEAPPKPRSFVDDLPQSVEDAILRSLEKDPNRRFSTCSELAVALGCQFLAGPAPPPEILMETEIKKMGGRWKTYHYPFSFRGALTHLALAPDALWGTHRTELMRWPLAELADLQANGRRKLSFRIHGVTGKDRQWFTFKNRKEFEVWQQALTSRLPTDPQAIAPDPQTVEPGASAHAEPRIEPVVLLKARPGTRFQLLGMVEAKARDRRSASASLAIRGSMMGADAVVDFNQERLPGFTKSEHRASGLAVRAVDDEGRLELKTRWFSNQIGKIAIIMLAVAGLEFTVDLLGLLTPGLPQWLMSVLNFAGGLSIAGLSAALVYGRWPQLVRPTALCFLSKVVATGLGMIATLLASAVVGYAVFGIMPDARQDVADSAAVAASVGGVTLVVLSMFVSASLLVFFLYLGRRAWRIDQEYRSLAGAMQGIDTTSPRRKSIGRLAWAAALFYVAVLIGGAFYNLYASATSALSMPRSVAVVKSSTGFTISGDPAEWNTLAWKLATDSNINQRDPAEALRLAEKAVSAEPKNSRYLTTLGVARYRTCDFSGAIEALTRSQDGRGPRGRDAFFLAMAHARLGRDGEAEGWFATANHWMRQNDPDDAMLRRIREEAFAVLDVANDVIRAPAQSAPKDAARSNKTSNGSR